MVLSAGDTQKLQQTLGQGRLLHQVFVSELFDPCCLRPPGLSVPGSLLLAPGLVSQEF